jgi:hypothetical protein
MKKLLSWAALALAAIWLFHNPAQAGHDIRQAVNDITAFASSL